MPENHTVIVTPTDRLNHLTSILPIPARQPGVASPSVLVLAQHTRSLHDSACMCVCSEEGLFTSIFTHINVLSVRVTHPVILRFPIRFCLCVTKFKHECEISQRLKLWHRNHFNLRSEFMPPTDRIILTVYRQPCDLLISHH